jgi:DNA-binding transcriptional ArsR family regulator
MIRRAASEDIFDAVSHPTRRAILRRLAGGEMCVSALAEPFRVTLGALSQHLKILRDAKVVRERRDGRRRIYRLNPGPLREVHDWVAFFEDFWKEKLRNLGDTLKEIHENQDRAGD